MRGSAIVTYSILSGAALVSFVAPKVLTVESSSAASEGEHGALVLSAMIRDFRSHDEEGGHPDFERYRNGRGVVTVGLVAGRLGPDGLPVFRSGTGSHYGRMSPFQDKAGNPINPAWHDPSRDGAAGELEPSASTWITSAESFSTWYQDVAGLNMSTRVPLSFDREDDLWVFEPTRSGFSPYFHPINGQLFGNSTGSLNCGFTTEVRALFEYDAGEPATVRVWADDDLWVFVDGRLVIDAGGVHIPTEQFADLHRLDLVDGAVYEIALFHAERRSAGSYLKFETSLSLRPVATAPDAPPADAPAAEPVTAPSNER
jgi:fibro-slime domain-containing protein